MSLKDDFKKVTNLDNYNFTKRNDFVLEIYVPGSYTSYHKIDFLMRCMTVQRESAISVIPFSQMDRESLEFYHGKLVEMGGKPPALPAIETYKGAKISQIHPKE